ncbi:hypothetical protein BH11BAC2_BH11BAC2_12300 [soil metagenome]
MELIVMSLHHFLFSESQGILTPQEFMGYTFLLELKYKQNRPFGPEYFTKKEVKMLQQENRSVS